MVLLGFLRSSQAAHGHYGHFGGGADRERRTLRLAQWVADGRPEISSTRGPKNDRYECDGWAVIDCKNMCVEEFVRTGVEADDARQRLNEAADLPGPRHD